MLQTLIISQQLCFNVSQAAGDTEALSASVPSSNAVRGDQRGQSLNAFKWFFNRRQLRVLMAWMHQRRLQLQHLWFLRSLTSISGFFSPVFSTRENLDGYNNRSCVQEDELIFCTISTAASCAWSKARRRGTCQPGVQSFVWVNLSSLWRCRHSAAWPLGLTLPPVLSLLLVKTPIRAGTRDMGLLILCTGDESHILVSPSPVVYDKIIMHYA